MIKHPPTWDLYLMGEKGNILLTKNASLETFLNKYFINLTDNIKNHLDYTDQDWIEAYKKLWETNGIIRSYYTDSWGHKWACFPSEKKLKLYLNKFIK